ncbi:MAG: CysS/YqeB C-terminal domain-containing protein [Paracoccaceae bacterium]
MTNNPEIEYLEISGPKPEDSDKVDALLMARRAARADQDFETADRIREILDRAGVIVIDSPTVTAWKTGPDFDPSKLETPE